MRAAGPMQRAVCPASGCGSCVVQQQTRVMIRERTVVGLGLQLDLQGYAEGRDHSSMHAWAPSFALPSRRMPGSQWQPVGAPGCSPFAAQQDFRGLRKEC